MITVSKTLFMAALVTVGAMSIEVPTANANYYGRTLGGVNLDAYCKRHHGRNSFAIVVEDHAGGWRCDDNAGNDFGISVQRACEETYRQRPIKATTVGNQPGDWRCKWIRRHP